MELYEILDDLESAINYLKSLDQDYDLKFQSELINNYIKDRSDDDYRKIITEKSNITKMSDELVFILYLGRNYEGTFTDDFFKFKDYGFCERNNIEFVQYEMKDIAFRFETVHKLLKNGQINPDWTPNY